MSAIARRGLATAARTRSRAIVYRKNGEPVDVLEGISYELPDPKPNEARVRFRLAAINPADVNVVQGSYPSKPRAREGLADEPVYVVGNEGVAEVEVAPADGSLKRGQWVVMAKAQLGTWSSHANIEATGLLPLPRSSKLSEVQAATLAVNPATAYRLLQDFATLEEGDWIIQNGANSAAGQAVIQLAAHMRYKTINIIRDRPEPGLQQLKDRLYDLGATQVITDAELEDGKAMKQRISGWTNGQPPKLGLNCVSGQNATNMARQLGFPAQLVTYGAMSKSPLSLPSSLFIFKGLTSSGFWLSRWYETRTAGARAEMAAELCQLYDEGKLREPDHEIIEVGAESQSDEQLSQVAREAVTRSGTAGKKLLLRFV